MYVRGLKSMMGQQPHTPPGKAQIYSKVLRQNFVVDEDKQELLPIRDIVETRNNVAYKSKPIGDRFHNNYHRREDNKNRGHFSVDSQSYKNIGGSNLLLDPREIILDLFRDKLKLKNFLKLKEILDIEGKANLSVPKDVCDEVVKEETFSPLDSSFSTSVLWSFIKESEKLMWLVKSSGIHSYVELIQNLLESKYSKFDQPDNTDTEGGVLASSTRELLPNSGVVGLHGTDCLTGVTNTPPKSPDLLNDEKMTPYSTISLANQKDKRKAEQLKMLKYIYRILDMVCNMPNKALRSKVPLNKKDVLSLLSENKYTSQFNKPQSTKALLGDERSPVSSPLLFKPTTGRGTPTSHPSPYQKRGPKSTIPSPGGQSIHTWDDLVALHERQLKQKRPSFGGTREQDEEERSVLNLSVAERISPTTTSCPKSECLTPRKHLTSGGSGKSSLWQSLINEKLGPLETASDEKHWSEKDKKSGLRKTASPAEIRFRRICKNFRSTNEIMDQELLRTLQKIERKKIASFRFKYGTLRQLRTLDFYEKHRLYVNRLNLQADQVDNEESDKCTWMLKLIQESNKISRNDIEFKKILQALMRFTYIDTSTPLYGRFIIEDIFLCNKSIFKRWMEHRQIPSVIEPRGDIHLPIIH